DHPPLRRVAAPVRHRRAPRSPLGQAVLHAGLRFPGDRWLGRRADLRRSHGLGRECAGGPRGPAEGPRKMARGNIAVSVAGSRVAPPGAADPAPCARPERRRSVSAPDRAWPTTRDRALEIRGNTPMDATEPA